jgi:hypothetical protein
MLTRIITGGQSGIEIAALDVARKLGIDHGGWLPKSTSKMNSDLISVYGLRETDSFGPQAPLVKNIEKSDGVLLITRGEKIERLKQTVRIALKYQRQFLGVDLTQYPPFEAASLINSWLEIQNVKTVFITGPYESEIPGIYRDAHKILETVVYLGFVKSDPHSRQEIKGGGKSSQSPLSRQPQSVQECVERLKQVLSLKERTRIANLQGEELGQLRSGLGEYIKNQYGLYGSNDALMESCIQEGKLARPLAEEACATILRALWNDLRQSHKLRLVR